MVELHKMLLANPLRTEKGKIGDTEREKKVASERSRKAMSMHPQPIPAIPEETARVARTILPFTLLSAPIRYLYNLLTEPLLVS
jgi:hypothetical protein